MLAAAGLTPVRTWGLHNVTNLLPSTLLHRPQLSRTLAAAFRALRHLDARVIGTAPALAFANNLVVLARRAQPSA
jgi:hypothetical protein